MNARTPADPRDLDRILWLALSGPQRPFSVGTDTARRYAPGFSPLLGFAAVDRPDFAALAPFCGPGEPFYTDGWTGPTPAGWQIDQEATMWKMVWRGGLPPDDAAPEAVRLGPEHAAQALALAQLTRPGPFGPRTPELGEYFGCFEGDRLVAMAGERMACNPWREISGVCTHPDAQGRGLARRLVLKLLRRQVLRGEQPFLHVMATNTGARRLYARMGFYDHAESVVRVVSRSG
jgi:ribosomal protein S18 acetylase RimI-like enzyme